MAGTESLKKIIDQICRDKGIDKELLIDSIEEAVLSAVRKKYGSRRDIEVQFNADSGEVEVFCYRTVVEEVIDEETEISLEDALELDPDVEIGEDLGEKMDNISELGRISAQSAKQVIIQRMREAEKNVIYELYKDRQGEIVNGIVQRFERGKMVVNLGRTDAAIPREGQIPKKSFRQGDRIRAYLLEVDPEARGFQLILSRTCNEFLAKLFEMEVPEIAEGIVKIKGCSRDPGFRAKIAVSSVESDVDPVGACVGLRGARVQNVVQELQGERIDIVEWHPDPGKYVYNAMKPANVSSVEVDEDNHQLLVIVPDDQLSLAIGRQGQNVKLASQLMNWRIDVKSETRYANLEKEEYREMLKVPGMDESLADRLFAGGITSVAMLAEADVADISRLARVREKMATELKENGLQLVGGVLTIAESPDKEGLPIDSTVDGSAAEQESSLQIASDSAEEGSEVTSDEEKLPLEPDIGVEEKKTEE